uniref:Uncharacterized protein n=1 Tax=Meloidogyne incognita TaxID=6306 RepID=A0A914L158_MELIC
MKGHLIIEVVAALKLMDGDEKLVAILDLLTKCCLLLMIFSHNMLKEEENEYLRSRYLEVPMIFFCVPTLQRKCSQLCTLQNK